MSDLSTLYQSAEVIIIIFYFNLFFQTEAPITSSLYPTLPKLNVESRLSQQQTQSQQFQQQSQSQQQYYQPSTIVNSSSTQNEVSDEEYAKMLQDQFDTEDVSDMTYEQQIEMAMRLSSSQSSSTGATTSTLVQPVSVIPPNTQTSVNNYSSTTHPNIIHQPTDNTNCRFLQCHNCKKVF